MWSSYYRNTKQKADRWQNEHFGWSSVSCSWVTINSLWLQSLLLFLFCIACSCAPTESTTSNSVSCTKSLNAKPHFPVLKISHPLEMQNSVTQIPIWRPKLLRSLLKANSMMKKLILSLSSHKLYNQRRLFKRDLENLSQNTSTSLSEWPEAQTPAPGRDPRPEAQTPAPGRDPRPEAQTPAPGRDPRPEAQTPAPGRDPRPEAQTPAPGRDPRPEAQTPAPGRDPRPEAQTPAPGRDPRPEAQTPAPGRDPRPEAQTPAPGRDPRPGAQTPAPGRDPRPGAQTPAPGRDPRPGAQTPAPGRDPRPEAQTPAPGRDPRPEAQTPAPGRDPRPEAQTPAPGRDPRPEAQTPAPGRDPRPEAQTPAPGRDPRPEAQTPAPGRGKAVSQMDAKTFPAVEGQMLSTLKHTTFAKPEAMTSIASLDEQVADPNFTPPVQSESTFPSTTQDFPYSNRKYLTKMNYTDLPSSPFPVTDGTKSQTENGSYHLTTFTLKTSSGSRNYGLNEFPISDLQTVNEYSATHKQATDRFNLLGTTVQPKPETSTFSNMLIPSLGNSTVSLQYSDVPVTRISATNSALGTSMGAVNTELYPQSSKPTISPILFDSLDVYTSFYQDTASWDLSSVTPLTSDIVDMSSTKRLVETKTSLNLDHNTADISHMTKQRMGSSSVVDGTSVGTSFASSNLAIHAGHDSSAPTILHTSKTAQTSEHDRSLNRQMGTVGLFSASTWQSQKMISTADRSHPPSWKTTYHTDVLTISSVTPSPCRGKNKACVLQIHDPANTQTPKSSETIRLSTVYKSTDSTIDTTMLSTSSSVTPNDRSTLVESTFINAYSELGFQSTTAPTFRYDDSNDVMNDNGKINQTDFNLTSTLASAMSSTTANKTLTTVTSLWKSTISKQFNSTIQPVQKIQTSWTNLYSTESNKASQSVNATRGQAPTFQKLPNVSLSSASPHHPTTTPAALPRTIITKSVADLRASSVQTSTYHPSLKDHFVSKMLSTRDPKQNIVTGPLSSAPTKTPSATIKKLTTSRLASLYQSSTKSMADTTSTIKLTPAPKVWIPQTDFPLKPKIATPINYSTRQKDSSAPTSITSVITMPFNFQLTGVSFSEQLTNRTSEAYRELEREVKLAMDKMFFGTFENYLETEIKAFLRGSVIVQSNIVFQRNIYIPSASDIVRTVLTYGTKTNYFGWSINGSTVELNGYTKSNLELEVLPMSFLVLRAGYIAVSPKNQEKQSFLDSLQKAVFQAIDASFPITNVSISQIRDVHGDLKVQGNLYLNSTAHTNVPSLMSSLLPLVNTSVDLSSIIVNGISNELQVYSINFRVTNKQFMLNLLDMSSSESQLLSKDLSVVVQAVLHDSNPLQVIIREFKSGSVVCRGDLAYQLPAPGSREVLKLFLKTLGSDGILGSSTYKVDFKSLTIGDSSPGPTYEYIDFPGYGVAIIVMCGLCILIFPIILFVCIKTKMLGHRKKATIQRRPDAGDRSHHFEMDNQAFRASIEQP